MRTKMIYTHDGTDDVVTFLFAKEPIMAVIEHENGYTETVCVFQLRQMTLNETIYNLKQAWKRFVHACLCNFGFHKLSYYSESDHYWQLTCEHCAKKYFIKKGDKNK